MTDVVLEVDPDRSDDRYDPITPRTVSVTTLDDDDGTFTLEAATSELEVGEDGTTDGFTIVLDAQPLDTVVFRLERRDTTEVALSPAVLFFAPGVWDQPQSVTVQGVDDAVLDGTQSSFVYVEVDSTRSDPAFVALGRDSISVRTLDDDAAGFSVMPTDPPSPSVDTTSVSEAGTSDTITVVLGAQPATDVVLSVTPSDAGEVSADPATLTFDAAGWNVPQTVVVSGVDDLALDGDQVTSLTFAIVPAASDDDFDGLAAIQLSVTTLDDDLPGLVIVESSGATVTDEAGAQPDQFTVALAAQPAGSVAFDLASANELEVTVSPSRLAFPSADWNVPQPVTVTGVDERFDDDDQVVPVVLTVDPGASDDDYDALPPDTVLVTNVDDDTAGFTLVESDGGSLVSEAGSTDTITIVLDARPVDSVVVTLLAADTTEVVVAPGLLSFDTDDWDVAQDIVVTGVDDGEPDGNRFSIVAIGISGALSDAAFATVSDQTIQVTTINDDTVSVDITPTSGLQTDEDGATATFDVVLGSQPLADVVVTVSSDDGGEGTAAPGSLTFTTATWDVPQTVTVTGIDDAIDDGNEPYSILTSVTSSDPSYAALDPPDVSVTNIDNDAAPALAIGGASVTEGDGGTVDVVLTVTQSLESTQDVSVAWTTVDGSAEAGTDYVANSGSADVPGRWPALADGLRHRHRRPPRRGCVRVVRRRAQRTRQRDDRHRDGNGHHPRRRRGPDGLGRRRHRPGGRCRRRDRRLHRDAGGAERAHHLGQLRDGGRHGVGRRRRLHRRGGHAELRAGRPADAAGQRHGPRRPPRRGRLRGVQPPPAHPGQRRDR